MLLYTREITKGYPTINNEGERKQKKFKKNETIISRSDIMSGPKVDIAEIRRQEMLKLEAAREERKNLSDKIQKLIHQVSDSPGVDIDLMMQEESLRSSCEKIKSQQEDCCKELSRFLALAKSGNEMLNVEEILANAQQTVSLFNNSIQGEIAVVSQMAESSEKFKELEANRQQLELAKKKKIVMLTEDNSSGEEEITQAEVDVLVEIFESEMNEFMTTMSMSGKHKNSVLLINHDLQEVIESGISVDRKQKRIKRLFADYKKMTALIKDEVAEMKLLYDEYVKECFDISAPIKQLLDFSSRKEIEEAITDAKELAETGMSKEYIKRQIDAVMAKHGYDVIKSDRLEEMTQSGQILYGVDKDTAINVFVSDKNQVTMRVVGVGFDSDISETENERLFQQQCAFCSMHPQITAELAMRGVVLHTKKHRAPDRKFNKKIQTKSKNGSQTTSRAKKELKRTELKTMRKE